MIIAIKKYQLSKNNNSLRIEKSYTPFKVDYPLLIIFVNKTNSTPKRKNLLQNKFISSSSQ